MSINKLLPSLGWAAALISLVERGVNAPSVAGLEDFAKALEVEVVDLFTFDRRRLTGMKPRPL